MVSTPLTQDEAAAAIVYFALSGALCPPEGKAVGYSLLNATPDYFTWSATLEEFDGPPEQDFSEAILSATGQHLSLWERFTDGALSISYKVTVKESTDSIYVVQLCHHGNVASTDSLMSYITKTISPTLLPVPPVYPIPHEKQRQETTAGNNWHGEADNPGDARRNVHLEPKLIGEVVADLVNDELNLRIDPDRHYSLGGPFSSVREYLRAYINASLVSLEKQQGIDEYKALYLTRIRNFVSNSLHNTPHIVEQIPVALSHSDMGPHNIIVSSEDNTDIKAIIDWEFVASAPVASSYHILEMFFRQNAPNGFGQEYPRSDELRQAFWGTIPKWKLVNESETTQVFLEWMKFGLFLKPE